MAEGDKKAAQLERELQEMREQVKRQQEEIEKMKMGKSGEEERKKEESRDDELKRTKATLERVKEESRAKDAELAKLRQQPPANIGFVDERSMEWKVEVKEIGTDGEKMIFSPYKDIGGLPFRLAPHADSVDDEKKLYVFLYFNENAASKTWLAPASKTWLARVDFTFTLDSAISPVSHTMWHLFHATSYLFGMQICPWANAVDPSKGFVQDGYFTIKAVIRLVFYYKNGVVDFSSPDPQLSDVTLLVGGKVFHASKHYLAHFSGFFKALFFSGFAEKNKDQIALPDINEEEFEKMLNLIYSHQYLPTQVHGSSVKFLLHLADFFDVPCVLWQCIAYLNEATDFSLAEKLQLTEQYRLPELQNDVIKKISTATATQTIINSPEFKTFSDPLQNFVFQKHFDFSAAQSS